MLDRESPPTTAARAVIAGQYLFCLVVDSIRTQVAARGAATDDDAAADFIGMGSRCNGKCSEGCSTLTQEAGEARRQKRRQKRKEKKRAGKSSASSAASGTAPSGSPAQSPVSSPGTSGRSSSRANAEATCGARSGKSNVRQDRSRSAKTDNSRRKAQESTRASIGAQEGGAGDGSDSTDGGLDLGRLHPERAASRDGGASVLSKGLGSKVKSWSGSAGIIAVGSFRNIRSHWHPKGQS